MVIYKYDKGRGIPPKEYKMFYLVINKKLAGKEAVEILNREIENGVEDEQIARIEIKDKTIYIYTKGFLNENGGQ